MRKKTGIAFIDGNKKVKPIRVKIYASKNTKEVRRMEKIDIEKLRYQIPNKTASQMSLDRGAITNNGAEVIYKINEIVGWANGVNKQLTELYQQQEELLKKNKMGYWKPELEPERGEKKPFKEDKR